ncbi:MAG: 5'-nucleotidase C-terminal domain-containing protein [Crocinitomicaceae bacterium]|nr:5'-nucleotidase C-terminal domain-containing protein [Crocinitomicaceae bacterium]
MIRVVYYLFGILFLYSCGSNSLQHQTQLMPVNPQIEKDSQIEKEISEYRKELEDSMNTVLAEAKVDFQRGKPNGNLNNLIADIVFKAGMQRARIHSIAHNNTIALLNWGGLRAPINKGKITIGTCFEVMPFENEIVIVEMTQEDLVIIKDFLIEKGGHPVSNMLVEKNEIQVAGHPLSDQHYFVITSDYLFNGGDQMSFFKGKKVIHTGYKIRDALIDYFYRNPVVEDLPEKRLNF